jgi:1,4-alpha-glucan branching enzyme
MSIKKKYLSSRPICKVTFRVPRDAAEGAETVHIVGEFNGWDREANPMKGLKSGEFTVTLDLETGREYQFRYLIDKKRWENDWEADKYVKTHFGDSENSVVIV